jgi:hypothetical protein
MLRCRQRTLRAAVALRGTSHGFLLQSWFLILFAVAGFFVFYTLGINENYKGEVAMIPLTRWVILGIGVVIVIFLVLKVLQDHNINPFGAK